MYRSYLIHRAGQNAYWRNVAGGQVSWTQNPEAAAHFASEKQAIAVIKANRSVIQRGDHLQPVPVIHTGDYKNEAEEI